MSHMETNPHLHSENDFDIINEANDMDSEERTQRFISLSAK